MVAMWHVRRQFESQTLAGGAGYASGHIVLPTNLSRGNFPRTRYWFRPSPMNQLLRHIDACNNARLPGSRVAFRIGAERIGWLAPALANALVGFPDITAGPNGVTLAESAAPEFPEIARALSARGFYRWRDEAFDIRANLDG